MSFKLSLNIDVVKESGLKTFRGEMITALHFPEPIFQMERAKSSNKVHQRKVAINQRLDYCDHQFFNERYSPNVKS